MRARTETMTAGPKTLVFSRQVRSARFSDGGASDMQPILFSAGVRLDPVQRARGAPGLAMAAVPHGDGHTEVLAGRPQAPQWDSRATFCRDRRVVGSERHVRGDAEGRIVRVHPSVMGQCVFRSNSHGEVTVPPTSRGGFLLRLVGR